MKSVCVKCGERFETNDVGRPARYCSTACRRATEYEIRRLQRHIERHEREAAHHRVLADGSSGQWAAIRANNHEAERLRFEARLKALLEDIEVGRREPS
jgi:hypothetical protein